MKLFYSIALSGLFSIATAQSELISSNVRLLPTSQIPNIYADAPAPLNEIQVNEHPVLSAATRSVNKKNELTAEAHRTRSYTNKKTKSYPKL